jgi:methionine synthase II (cobalamin-independent)
MKSFLIGSLPFKVTCEAIEFIKKIDIPTLCTLPQLDGHEFMLNHAFIGLKSFDYVRNRVHYKKVSDILSPFEFYIEDEFFDTFKGEYKWQIAGPVTMIKTMEMHEYDDLLLEEYLDKIVMTQRKFNQINKSPNYLFLDEPMLGTSSELKDRLVKFIHNLKKCKEFSKTTFGMHSCSKLDFDISEIPVELFALDYNLYSLDEWKNLQASLEDRLVAIVADSNGQKLNYTFMNEKYKSTSCGQALCKNKLEIF